MLRIVKEAPDESLSNFPKWFRDQMAPQITGTVDENEHIVSDKEQVTTISSMISRTRSPYRIGFCNSVNITATEIINRFKNDSDWTEIFNKHDTDKVRRSLSIQGNNFVVTSACRHLTTTPFEITHLFRSFCSSPCTTYLRSCGERISGNLAIQCNFLLP